MCTRINVDFRSYIKASINLGSFRLVTQAILMMVVVIMSDDHYDDSLLSRSVIQKIMTTMCAITSGDREDQNIDMYVYI